MVAPWHVLGDVKAEAQQLGRQTLVWTCVVLAAAIFVAVIVLAWARRWSKQPGDEPESAGDQLAQFRTLYERGELSPEEFDRLRGVLTERLRGEAPGGTVATPDPPQAPPADGAGSGR
jgi:hypothetical protein